MEKRTRGTHEPLAASNSISVPSSSSYRQVLVSLLKYTLGKKIFDGAGIGKWRRHTEDQRKILRIGLKLRTREAETLVEKA
jgi:hypothetical protein